MPLTTADVNAIWDKTIDGVPMGDRLYFSHRRAQAALDKAVELEAKIDALTAAVAAIKTGTVTGEVTVTGGTLTVGK